MTLYGAFQVDRDLIYYNDIKRWYCKFPKGLKPCELNPPAKIFPHK